MNIFADIDLPNADRALVKAELIYKIDGLMKARGLTQVAAAKLFGVKQPDISKMLRGDFRQFSVGAPFAVSYGARPGRGNYHNAEARGRAGIADQTTMTAADGICECCNRERRIVGVASSAIGPFSLAWCRECLEQGAEPLWMVETIWSPDMEDIIVFHEGDYKLFSEVIAGNGNAGSENSSPVSE